MLKVNDVVRFTNVKHNEVGDQRPSLEGRDGVILEVNNDPEDVLPYLVGFGDFSEVLQNYEVEWFCSEKQLSLIESPVYVDVSFLVTQRISYKMAISAREHFSLIDPTGHTLFEIENHVQKANPNYVSESISIEGHTY